MGNYVSVALAESPALPAFSHRLLLPRFVSEPSTLIVTASEGTPERVQVLLTLDDSLLLLPMARSGSEGTFLATFPKPRRRITYRFQFMLPGGAGVLTDTFSADPACADRILREKRVEPQRFASQNELLQDASDLEGEVSVLQVLLQAIRAMEVQKE
ncbi:MAG: hypothetical protein KDD69_10195 [Bdellovibrionales bacterium]|nr:hypothetical protein [Bdellovibrionales bacterium]